MIFLIYSFFQEMKTNCKYITYFCSFRVLSQKKIFFQNPFFFIKSLLNFAPLIQYLNQQNV